MGRHRSGSRSYSPRRRSRTPPRRKRYDEPRHRHRERDRDNSSRNLRDRRSPAPTGLLVRNVSLDTRPEDLRTAFEKFGPVKDIYLPRNYYTGEARGFGFVKFRYPEDAAEAKDRLNHTIIGGREIRIVYAEENRKTPHEMRKVSRPSVIFSGRRTPPRSPRRRYHSHSRSPSLERRRSRSVSRSRSSRSERDYKSGRRSPSPRETSPSDGRRYRAKERSESPRNISLLDAEHKLRESDSPRDVPSQRSVSPRDESPRSRECNPKQKTTTSRDVSPCNEDDKSSRRSPSPRESSVHSGRSGNSPVHERVYKLNHESLSHEENGGSSSRLISSPRKNDGRISRSRSNSP